MSEPKIRIQISVSDGNYHDCDMDFEIRHAGLGDDRKVEDLIRGNMEAFLDRLGSDGVIQANLKTKYEDFVKQNQQEVGK